MTAQPQPQKLVSWEWIVLLGFALLCAVATWTVFGEEIEALFIQPQAAPPPAQSPKETAKAAAK